MNASDIENALRDIGDKKSFKIHVIGDIRLLPKPSEITSPNNFECFIINYHENRRNMGHWLSVCKNNQELWFFDSLGFGPKFYSDDIYNYIKKHQGIKHYKNNRQLQSFSSIVCGGYQVLFIYFLHQTRNFFTTIQKLEKMFPYKENHILNDEILLEYLYKHFKNIGPCKQLFCNYYSITKELCERLCVHKN